MQLDEIPDELSTLNALELRLVSLRVAFMKLVALPSSKQRSIQGPAVNVPSKLDSLCTMLPRLPTETELIAFKLKRKLKYKRYYMYDYVSPEKLTNALEWLKANNPLYADVNVNEQWVDDCQTNDNDMFRGLVRQPETNSDCNTPQGHTQDDSTNHNEPMECESSMSGGNSSCSDIAIVFNRLTTLARENGFTVHDVPGDGNCLFNAVAYQLESVGASEMREIAANHFENNSVFYRDFLAQPVHSGNAYNVDTEAPSDQDAMIDSVHDIELQMQLRWERYIKRFRNGAWGDHLAIQGISNVFNVAINVLSSEHSNVIHNVPRSGNVEHEVYIGWVMQYHHVDLDKVAVSDNVANTSENDNTDDTNDPLSDDVIAAYQTNYRWSSGKHDVI